MQPTKRVKVSSLLQTAFLVIASLLTSHAVRGQTSNAPKPLGKDNILAGLSVFKKDPVSTRKKAEKAIIDEVKKKGVSFEQSPKDEAELCDAGASEELIKEVRNNYRPQESKVASEDSCWDVKSTAVFYKNKEISTDPKSQRSATTIVGSLKRKGCPVTDTSPDLLIKLKDESADQPDIDPSDPPIRMKYFLPCDKYYAQAIADYIKKDTDIDLVILPRPDSTKYPNQNQKKLEVWFLKKAN